MRKISYEVIKKNSKLTDFSGIKEMVIANQVKDVPNALKSSNREYDKQLGFFC